MARKFKKVKENVKGVSLDLGLLTERFAVAKKLIPLKNWPGEVDVKLFRLADEAAAYVAEEYDNHFEEDKLADCRWQKTLGENGCLKELKADIIYIEENWAYPFGTLEDVDGVMAHIVAELALLPKYPERPHTWLLREYKATERAIKAGYGGEIFSITKKGLGLETEYFSRKKSVSFDELVDILGETAHTAALLHSSVDEYKRGPTAKTFEDFCNAWPEKAQTLIGPHKDALLKKSTYTLENTKKIYDAVLG